MTTTTLSAMEREGLVNMREKNYVNMAEESSSHTRWTNANEKLVNHLIKGKICVMKK